MNDDQAVRLVQQKLKDLGLYSGLVDGAWGRGSQAGFDALVAGYLGADGGKYDIAWSAKVSPAFVARVKQMADQLGMPEGGADALMACMAFETGRTFSPSIQNGAGQNYFGLIQFGEAAAKDCGTTVSALVKMTAEDQLEYVYKFFKPYAGKLFNLGDIYMRILWPKAVGKPEDYVLWDSSTRQYAPNKGLDVDKNGNITKREAAGKVQDQLTLGLKPENRRKLA